MSGRRTQILVALVAAGAALAASKPVSAQAAMKHIAVSKKASHAQYVVKVKEATPGLAAQATITADSARKLALAQVPRGRIAEAELEEENGTLVYSFDIKTSGKSGIDEVLIDAKTGALISKSHETAAAEKKEAAEEKAAKSKPVSKP